MADINVTKTHSLDMDTLKERMEGLAKDLKEKYSVNYSWSGNTCTLNGAGLKKGVVTLSDSTVTIEVTLGMLAKMLKPKIEEQINSKMDKVLS